MIAYDFNVDRDEHPALLNRYQRCMGWKTRNSYRNPEVHIANACIGKTSEDNACMVILSTSQA